MIIGEGGGVHLEMTWLMSPQEFSVLNEDANIYKLIGPVLVKQDRAEAVMNVDKRLEFIEAEMYVPLSPHPVCPVPPADAFPETGQRPSCGTFRRSRSGRRWRLCSCSRGRR